MKFLYFEVESVVGTQSAAEYERQLHQINDNAPNRIGGREVVIRVPD